MNNFEKNDNTKKYIIGSIKNKKINFDKDECFFNKNDINPSKKQIHDEIVNYIDPDYLGLRKKLWNPSVSVPKYTNEEIDHDKKLLNIRMGLENQKIPLLKEKHIYEGCDSRNKFNNWNISNLILNKEIKENELNLKLKSKKNTLLYSKNNLRKYTTPIQLQDIYTSTIKQEGIKYKDLMQQLREDYVYKNPNASEEKIMSAVFRLFQEYKLKEAQQNYFDNLNKKGKISNSLLSNNNIDTLIRSIQINKINKKPSKKLNWIYDKI